DLARQFQLASEILGRENTANGAVIRIRRIKADVAERVGKTAALAATGNALLQRLSAVEEAIYQVKNRSGQDPLNFPIRLNDRLAALRRSVEDSDTRPPDAAYVVLKELSAELDQELGRLDAIVKTELAAFNRAAAARGAPPVAGGDR